MSELKKIRIAVAGTGQRASAFVKRMKDMPGVELAALCDINRERLQSYARQNKCEDIALFTSLDEMLADKLLDAVVITVPDGMHKEVAVKCFAAGKHVMLEKPMALTVEDCKEIVRAKEKSGKILQLGFVLRSTPFYRKVKEIVDQGVLGQIMGISAAEYLKVSHSASYMRRWHRKSANSGGFIVTKCSHDLDMLNWLSGSQATRVASFGDNNFFLPKKSPATHCSKCQEKDCRFRFNPQSGGFVFMTEDDRINPSHRNFDLCVYNDDKDIVDNQVAILEYVNGVRATFSLQLFRATGARMITINGTEAYLSGCLEENRISICHSRTGQVDVHEIKVEGSGHSGGDERFVLEFVDCIRNGTAPVADLRSGLASTVTALAVEKARKSGSVISIDPAEYRW